MNVIQVDQFGNPDVLKFVEKTDKLPGTLEVSVEIKAVGVNPVDTYIRAGVYPLKPTLPYTPGNDAAGIITVLGDGVDQFQVGDRVYLFGQNVGTYAEQVVCSAANVFPLPDNVSFSAGAGVGVPYVTAYYGLIFRGQAKPGETVLIHGASGAVGLAAVQIAKAHGMRVVGTAGSEAGLELIQSQGVDAALNHKENNYLDALNDLTDGIGPDVILEMLANVNLDKDLKVVAKCGRIVVIGNRGTIEINPRDTMGKNASIIGMAAFNAKPEEMDQIHCVLHAGLTDGRFKPVIRKELPLASAAEAHRLVLEPGAQGKIVLIP